jgi:hypothetical protein
LRAEAGNRAELLRRENTGVEKEIYFIFFVDNVTSYAIM